VITPRCPHCVGLAAGGCRRALSRFQGSRRAGAVAEVVLPPVPDASLGLDRLLPMAAVRLLGECDQPPITTWLGSGICGDHLLVQLQRATP